MSENGLEASETDRRRIGIGLELPVEELLRRRIVGLGVSNLEAVDADSSKGSFVSGEAAAEPWRGTEDGTAR